jgi:5-methylcytosine-specific restriction endonuclease McrA
MTHVWAPKQISKNNRNRAAINRSYDMGQRRCYCGVQLSYQPGQPNSATFEHMVPKSQGGTRERFNGMVICFRCNNSRGNMCWLKWMKKNNPPKKEWLIQKYLNAVQEYQTRGKHLTINKKTYVHIENLTVNITNTA